MFNSMKKTYSRKTVSKQINEYGESIDNYTDAEDVSLFVSLISKQLNAVNDMRVLQCSHVGITADEISMGDIIGDRFIVEFINESAKEKIVFMREMESNGYF